MTEKNEYFGKIIDAHGHIYPEKIAQKATEAIAEFYSIPMAHIGSIECLKKSGERAGIKKQLVCSTATAPEQVGRINDFIAAACVENASFFGFGTMHPDYAACEDELGRIKLLGLRGVKLHSDFQRYRVDDPSAVEMYRKIAKAGLPVLFHMGDDKRPYSEPSQLRRVLTEVPDLTAIGAHFGGYQRWDAAVRELRGFENLFFDTSSSLAFISPDRAAEMIELHGEDRFFYGTDFPMWDHAEEFARFMKIPLSGEQREKILFRNFERLFELT